MWHGRHLIIGHGQVGSAVFALLIKDDKNTVAIRDIDDLVFPADVVHICFPCVDLDIFKEAVRRYQAQYQPELTIIHSTVPVGTSRSLGAVHSPIMGRHPDIAADQMHYYKFFGGTDPMATEVAAEIFANCGLET